MRFDRSTIKAKLGLSKKDGRPPNAVLGETVSASPVLAEMASQGPTSAWKSDTTYLLDEENPNDCSEEFWRKAGPTIREDQAKSIAKNMRERFETAVEERLTSLGPVKQYDGAQRIVADFAAKDNSLPTLLSKEGHAANKCFSFIMDKFPQVKKDYFTSLISDGFDELMDPVTDLATISDSSYANLKDWIFSGDYDALHVQKRLEDIISDTDRFNGPTVQSVLTALQTGAGLVRQSFFHRSLTDQQHELFHQVRRKLASTRRTLSLAEAKAFVDETQGHSFPSMLEKRDRRLSPFISVVQEKLLELETEEQSSNASD